MATSNLYDPTSPNNYDSYQPPTVSSDCPPSPQTAYPRFLDTDDPDPSDHFPRDPLSYDEETHSPGPIQAAILSSKEAADQRVMEAETMFGSIATILDQHCACNSHMSAQQTNALKSFCDDLVGLASKHFEAYIRGTSPQKPLPHGQEKESASKSNNAPTSNSKHSYASIVKSNKNTIPKTFIETKKKNPASSQRQHETTPDERL